MLSTLFSLYLKMLVLYGPFFVLSCFISLTPGFSDKEKQRLAWRVGLSVMIASILLYLFGRLIFDALASPSMPSALVLALCCLFLP